VEKPCGLNALAVRGISPEGLSLPLQPGRFSAGNQSAGAVSPLVFCSPVHGA